MADEEKKEEGKEEPAKKGGGKLVIILVLVVVLLGGGGAAAFFLLGGKKGGAKKADDGPDDSAVAKMGPTLSMRSFIINLDEPGGARYLKLSVDLELRKALNEEQAKYTVRVRDAMIVYLSGLRMIDVQKRNAKLKLKKALVKLANKAYRARRVRNVYFKEFVIQ
jgi:flagellar FliL protein